MRFLIIICAALLCGWACYANAHIVNSPRTPEARTSDLPPSNLPSSNLVAQDNGTQDTASQEQTHPDVAAIESALESYIAAYNAGDAKALALHWGEAGQYTLPDGTVVQGRVELEQLFTAHFAESKNRVMELEGTLIEFLSPNVAKETGMARVILDEGEPSETYYIAIHVKGADGWKIDSVSEDASIQPAPSHYSQLSQLEWMIGDWVDAGGDATVATNCQWTVNQNFITRSFKVYVEGGIQFEGTEVIGWDPANQTIRSWMFDSDGGFAAGKWTGGESHWTVQTINTLPDGRQGSATHVYDLVDENTFRFQSVGRQLDGELLPNIEPVTIVREIAN